MAKWNMWVMGKFVEIHGTWDESHFEQGLPEYLLLDGVLDLESGVWWTEEEIDWLLSSLEPMRSIERACVEIDEQLFWLNMPCMAVDRVRNELLG